MLRIKDVLKEKGLTQTELAQKLGVSQVALNKAINGNPTIETLQKIADVLDVDIRDLLEPTKTSTQTELFRKDNYGGFVSVGFIDTTKIQNVSDHLTE
ncbi:MAG: helix-turn-helix transcriptional regulator [Bacteroidota bacterium]|nr:helix-turn-helix transcriptional regulator [Bacteroidota bacterium]